MPPQQQRSPQVICAENIALLYLLHTVPSKPSTRKVQNIPKDSENRRLSLEQERQLTGMLAVLSSIEENINFTTAVAIRELRAPRNTGQHTLEILLAVNKSSPDSAEPYLEASRQGLGRVLRTLSQATEQYEGSLEAEIFAEIVSVCQERILSRLRFGKAKRDKQKPPLQNALTEMCTALLGRKGAKILSFIKVTRTFIAALDDYGKHQVKSKIPQLIEEAEAWTRLEDMDDLFSKHRSLTMNCRIYQENRQIISKIAQYRTAARRLYRMARSCQPLRSAVVVPIRLGPEAFYLPDTTGYSASLAETYKRLTTAKPPPRLATICRYVGKSTTAENYFVSAAGKTLGDKSKVHAEIQVLTHLKSAPTDQAFTSRFVQSNKKACFLCNQLLMLNGLPAIPRSHGRLYPGWRIPMIPVMAPLQLQLNTLLAQTYDQSITLLLEKKKKIDLPYPCESSSLSMSDVAASEVAQIAMDNHVSINLPQEPKQSPILQVVELEIPSSTHESSEESDEETSSVTSEAAVVEIEDGFSKPTVTDDTGPPEASRVHTHSVSTAAQGQSPLIHRFDGPELMVEYTIGPDAPKLKTLQYQAINLSKAEIEQLRDTHSEVVAVETMKEGAEITLPGTSPFYIDFGNTIAKLVLYN